MSWHKRDIMNLDQDSFPCKLVKSEGKSPEEGPAGVAGEGPEVEAGPGGGAAPPAPRLHHTLQIPIYLSLFQLSST